MRALMKSVNRKKYRRRPGGRDQAAGRGEAVVITRRGRRVAQLGPVADAAASPLPDLSALRASVRVKGRSLSQTVSALRAETRY
jgi:antitoxin (DNA-binding transcriptional repressor) of toxin-antitoxin stability system